ncbi:MAG: Hsp33 family molecular chaperone HslO [Proteobacteria bacterium]|nr:Hsp33 family molecular chaperone HslO [Pseudomonadota bacterium]
MTGSDEIQPFRIEGLPVRGRLVRLTETAERVLSAHDYPDAVSSVLAEAMALTGLLAGALKFDGLFTLETRGDGAVHLIVVDLTSDGKMRAYAAYDRARLAEIGAAIPRSGGSVLRLLGSGHLIFTVDQVPAGERYQGVVALEGATLADCAHAYFRDSEQIPTGIKLCAGQVGEARAWRAGGVMVQRMPEGAGLAKGEGLTDEELEDGWRRVVILMSSATPEELIGGTLSPRALLRRLFHEDGVWVFKPAPLSFGCRCSRTRAVSILCYLPPREVADFTIEGKLEVTCQFCNSVEIFTEEEVASLCAT